MRRLREGIFFVQIDIRAGTRKMIKYPSISEMTRIAQVSDGFCASL